MWSLVLTLLILENGLGARKHGTARNGGNVVLTLLILENGLGVASFEAGTLYNPQVLTLLILENGLGEDYICVMHSHLWKQS